MVGWSVILWGLWGERSNRSFRLLFYLTGAPSCSLTPFLWVEYILYVGVFFYFFQ